MIKQLLLLLMLTITSFSTLANNDYTGTESCIGCHEDQAESWKGSDHERAMDHANNESVLGDFDNKTFKSKNRDGRFFKKGDEFWVEIKEHGKPAEEFKISYTFGYVPLQQFMIEFEDGSVQLIPFTWDSRSLDDGGQRWYDLYPDTTKNDEFYWKNKGQNWNFMCADCHSTELKKGYDKDTNTYQTTWKEINVGCEACHGKGSKHIELANKESFDGHSSMGFDRDLSQSVKEWTFNEDTGNLTPKHVEETDQVTVCAQCHSRRLQISEEGDTLSGDLFDKYIVSNINNELYHSDGQIYDENYVYGSFKQSKMAESGVTCTNCHDPHTSKLKIPKEQVCSQCHSPSTYSSEKHTFHKTGTEGDQCVSCHMPETTYMQVDKRADHSWHVPNPAESAASQSPNVCTNCHEDKDLRWADKQVKTWYPKSKRYEINENSTAYIFNQDRQGNPQSEKGLVYIGQESEITDIIRASALERMINHPTQNTYVSLLKNVNHEDSQVRTSVSSGMRGFPLSEQWNVIKPMLTDEVLAVRTNAVAVLVPNWSALTDEQKKIAQPALDEYQTIQSFNSDRAFGRNNLANIHVAKGEFDLAIKEYNMAMTIEPYFESSYKNLSALYAQLNNNDKAQEVLEKGISNNPESGKLNHSLSLHHLRLGDKLAASKSLKNAISVDKNNVDYLYLYGLSLEKIDIDKSIEALNKTYEISKQPQHLYNVCDVMLRNKHKDANQCVLKLSTLAPNQVIKELNSKYK